MPSGAQRQDARRVEPGQVAGVGHHHEGSPTGDEGDASSLGESSRPVVGRQHRPHRPGRFALGDRSEEGRPGPVPAETRLGRSRQVAGFARRRRLGPCVARRHAEPDDIDEVARPPIGHRTEQRDRVVAEHRFVAHRALDEAEIALVLAVLGPPEDVAIDESPGKAHAHSRAGGHYLVQVGRDEIVEGPVQVW